MLKNIHCIEVDTPLGKFIALSARYSEPKSYYSDDEKVFVFYPKDKILMNNVLAKFVKNILKVNENKENFHGNMNKKFFGDSVVFKSTPILEELRSQIQDYFNKKLSRFTLPLYLGEDDFRREVLLAISNIELGEVSGYGRIASGLGRKNYSRLVGRMCGSNLLPIIIPCHRVVTNLGVCRVKKSLNFDTDVSSNFLRRILGGYALGLEKKLFLLKLEGVCRRGC